LALGVGHGHEALQLAQTARQRAGKASGRLTGAFLAVAEAEGYAAIGDARSCGKAIAEAETAIAQPTAVPDAGWIDFFDEARLESYKGACFLRLGLAAEAEASLRRALGLVPESSVKYRCITAADLAATLADQGKAEESANYATEALDMALPLRYSAGLDRVREVAVKLSPHWREGSVSPFFERLTATGYAPTP